jgi:nitroreductase
MAGSSPYRRLKGLIKNALFGFCHLLNRFSHAIQQRVLHTTLEENRSNIHMAIPPEKMDRDLLGQYIRFVGHMLEKAVRNEFVEGRGREKYKALKAAVEEWEKRGYPGEVFVSWAKENISYFDQWTQTRKPQIIPAKHLPRLGENPAFIDVIHNRVSIRFWEERPIEKEKLDKILEAATCAPTSCNRQPWKFYVVDNAREGRASTAAGVSNVSLREKAPAVIYITIDERLYPERYAPAIDAGIAGLQMTLTATALGLGSCLMYGGENFPQEETRKKFRIPDYQYIYLIVLLGYPAETTGRNKRVTPNDACQYT